MSIPSPFIFTKHGLSYRVELDAHYISDEEMQTLRRYIADLKDENEKLRELVRDIWDAYRCEEVAPNAAKHWHDRMRELGVDDG